MKSCLLEEDSHKDESRLPQNSSSHTETKSNRNSMLRDAPVSSISSANSNSNLLSESLDAVSVMESVDCAPNNKTYSPEVVASDEQNSTSAFDYELFMKILPTGKKITEEYLLHEYDSRLKMQIAYQAANFELYDALHENNRQFKALIYEQRRFEKSWPLTRTRKFKQSVESLLYQDKLINQMDISERETCFLELVKEGQILIEIIQFGIDLDFTNP